LKDNVGIFKEMIPQLMRFAPGALFLVVTNPVDVLSYVTHKVSAKPWQEIIGSGTVLDSARLRLLLSQHCKIDARNIHAYILGEHGDSEFAAWSAAMIGGVPLLDYCHTCNKCDAQINFKNIFEDVKNFAYEIIARKGETSYGIGLALTRISEAVIKNENSILPVSCYIEDYYDVGGIYMSLPAVVNNKGIREVLRLRLADEEVKYLRESASAIAAAIKSVGL
jgi:L-lactate dehydrogenase